MSNQIGQFTFVKLSGEIQPPGPKVEVVQRPGLNGTAWRYIGFKGDPFMMESISFVTQNVDTHQLLINYRQSVGGSYTMVDSCGDNWDVFVEDVRIQQPRFVIAAVWGGHYYGNGYTTRCIWTLRMTN